MAKEIRNRWAFLVGVNHYREAKRFRRLNHCVNDVLALEKLLKQVGFGVICLHDHLDRNEPRFPDKADTVKAELRGLQETIGPDDLLLVYFACHGTRSLSAADRRPYLILRETRSSIPETALAVADLKVEMQKLKAERQILLLDACHMGLGEDERGDEMESVRQFIRNVHELATGFELLTPSTAQQTTRESDDLQHGVFSRFVLEGLRGEGEAMESATETQRRFVTASSLSRYVSNKMLIWSAEKGYEQIPQRRKEGSSGDFILVDYRYQPMPTTVLTQVSASLGMNDASRSSTTALSLGAQLKLEDRKRKLKKEKERLMVIDRRIEEGVDFEEEGKLETRKDGIFQRINALEKEIAQLEQGYE